MPLSEDDPRHGTPNGYGNLGCRCDACRAANTANHREYMQRVRGEGRVLGEHGTRIAYDCGCRCAECREAHNKRSREYKASRRAMAREVNDTNGPTGRTQ